ncbi:putative methyltransferase type 11 [Diplodia seriata]|uniref:Putative methyltransferase type 11 n=1 Tax=Diplodia seriata TaxID=420778 RepID=A0A0G2EIY3_9PEZI|nr:putative methyltransferase type 11 [Diplodia seriata]
MSNPTTEPALEVDTSLDSDSAAGSDMQSYSTSLASSVQDYKVEHGRRFHAYREGAYHFPNDDKEQDRLDMVHHMQMLAKGRKLFLAPLSAPPKRILDVGTGTGIWAIEAGDAYPDAEIIGNDLSPIQPHWGGWAEFSDYEMQYRSDDASIPGDSQMARLADLLVEGCEKIGRTVSPGPRLQGWMEDAGFVRVEARLCKLPVGAWARDPALKAIGAWNFVQTFEGLEAFVLGSSKDALE